VAQNVSNGEVAIDAVRQPLRCVAVRSVVGRADIYKYICIYIHLYTDSIMFSSCQRSPGGGGGIFFL